MATGGTIDSPIDTNMDIDPIPVNRGTIDSPIDPNQGTTPVNRGTIDSPIDPNQGTTPVNRGTINTPVEVSVTDLCTSDSAAGTTPGSIENPTDWVNISTSDVPPSEVIERKLRQRYDRAIILLGKTGVGKVFIAQHIFKNDAASLSTLGSLDSVTREARLFVHNRIHDLHGNSQGTTPLTVRVIIMDTNGLNGPKHKIKEILRGVEDVGPVNAVFFVMKFGRVTIDDCKPFNDIVAHLRGSEFSGICHLVVTGCEGKNRAGRDSVISLYKSDPMTRNICSFVKEIVPIGFPDISSIIPALRPHYEKDIKEDEKALLTIVEKSTSRCEIPRTRGLTWEDICPIL